MIASRRINSTSFEPMRFENLICARHFIVRTTTALYPTGACRDDATNAFDAACANDLIVYQNLVSNVRH